METEKGIVRSKFIPPEAFFKSLIVVSESRSIESFVNHKWAETDHSRYITSTSAELFWGRRLCSFYAFNLNRSSLVFFFFYRVVVLCSYLFGRLPQNITYTPSAPEAVTQYSDDAHEQGVTRSLFVLYHHRWGLHSNGGYEDTAVLSFRKQTTVLYMCQMYSV